MGWSLWLDWETTTDQSQSYTSWLLPFSPHWRIGGVFLIGLVSAVVGLILGVVWARVRPEFFRNGRNLQPLNTELAQLVHEGRETPPAQAAASS
jgi:hypothetical protein